MEGAVVAYREFVQKWVHKDYQPVPVPRRNLEAVEAELSLRFPVSYFASMTEIGPCSPAAWLLNGIVDNFLSIIDLSDFMTPSELVQSLDWRDAGLPRNLQPFANDSIGNMFCFNTMQLDARRRVDAPIWFWDHDEREHREIAKSFNEWIERFNDVPKEIDP